MLKSLGRVIPGGLLLAALAIQPLWAQNGPLPKSQPLHCLSFELQSTDQPPRLLPLRRRALRLEQQNPGTLSQLSLFPLQGSILFANSPLSFEWIDGAEDLPEPIPFIRESLLDFQEDWDANGFATPEAIDVILLRSAQTLKGFTVPRGERILLVLEIPPSSTPEALGQALLHQWAHAVALSTGDGVPAHWAEPFAVWASSLEHKSEELLQNFDARLESLPVGLEANSADQAMGNALWFEVLHEALAPATVRAVIEELGDHRDSTTKAFHQGIFRSSGATFSEAMREFQLWTALVGTQASPNHFTFATELAPNYPSVQAIESIDLTPTLGPLGFWQMQLAPSDLHDGLKLRLSGDTQGSWAADLLLRDAEDRMSRTAFQFNAEGEASLDFPLDGYSNITLLIRRLDESSQMLPISIRSNPLEDFPFVWGEAQPSVHRMGAGMWLQWSTEQEQSLAGFYVYRSVDGKPFKRISPIGIPAVGGPFEANEYSFFDASLPLTGRVQYRVEGHTREGVRVSKVTDPFRLP